jgi:hypothetical protein
VPANFAVFKHGYLTISLVWHSLDRSLLSSLQFSWYFPGRQCLEVPSLPLTFSISLEAITADILHWVWLGCRVKNLMVEILEGTLVPLELQKSEHIGGKRVPVTGLRNFHP